MMAEHTPLPWFVGKDYYGGISIRTKETPASNIVGDDAIFENTGHGAGDMSPEDAAFIVRAVNAHDELVAALETVEWLEWIPRDGLGAAFCPFCHAWKIEGHAPDCHLAAALAKAKENGT